MTGIRVLTVIDAPPAAVWAVLEPIEDHVQWMADAESITFTGAQTRGVDTSFTCLTRVGPIRLRDAMTVTAWEPGRTMGVRHHGLVTGSGRFTLEPADGDRTVFTWTEELDFPWWLGGGFGSAVGGPLVLAPLWRGNLRRLKALVEKGSAA